MCVKLDLWVVGEVVINVRERNKTTEYPRFNTKNEIHRYTARLAIEGYGRFSLPPETELEFLESLVVVGAGIVLAHIPLKGGERFTATLGFVSQRGDPYVVFTSLATNQERFFLDQQIAKEQNVTKWEGK